MSEKQIIGELLRAAREDADLTQSRVAKALGISLWSYNRLENGRRRFEPQWIADLPAQIRPAMVEFFRHRAERELALLREVGRIRRPQNASAGRIGRPM